ncbi:MAG: hypothetical protein ACW990_07530 [Promethearchaeota archaeon]
MNTNHIILENDYWELCTYNNSIGEFIYRVTDRIHNKVYSDQDYHYSILTSRKRGSRFSYLPHLGAEINARHLESRKIFKEDNETLVIEGKFQGIDLQIRHEFKLEKDSRWLHESITIINLSKKKVRLGYINLGFKKQFFTHKSGWIEHLDEMILTSIPSRRFFGYEGDRRKEFFTAADILYDAWISNEVGMPGYCAEGWTWGNSKIGIIICKYNPSQIEFSRFTRIATKLPGRGAEDSSIIFGGVSLCEGNPESATILKPDESYIFGVSKYASYVGDYKDGYYLYRNHLEENGHRFEEGYNPPLHWNELYNLGWASEKVGFFVSDTEFKPYTLEDLYSEAALAKDIGAESLYLDPGWNTSLGSEIWNEERFGSLKNFSKTIHEKFGLKLALHLMMNFEGEHEPDEFYLRSKKGVKVVADPYIGLYSVCANDNWVKEKTKRILELAKDNIDFFMFDFTDFSTFMVDDLGCFSKEHGHEIPMRRQTHAENIFKVIQNVKKHYPKILIEAHTRGVKHQLYYQHNLPYSFDENWGFECMWNPMTDLLSGRSTQLFEYNLAYSIPLYLHINENSDNEHMLQFWWYASLVRHLGVGGLKDKNDAKYKALKQAIALYKKIKPLLTKGTFYGINYDTHLHVNHNDKLGIVTAYNLTSRVKKVEIELDLLKYNLECSLAEIYNGINQKLSEVKVTQNTNKPFIMEVEIPPLSPVIVIFKE